jgi:UPF0755 protein
MIWRLAGILILASFLAACAGAFWASQQYASPGPLLETKLITIPKGTGTESIASILERESVISSRYVFMAVSVLSQKKSSLKAGEYEFESGISMKAVLDKIAQGDVYQRQFTIPEGLTSFEIVQILNAVSNMEGIIEIIPPEGSLLPETYRYVSGESRSSRLKLMENKMTETMKKAWEEREADLPFASSEQALTLASIVEKETGIASERKRIAGVFINRLKKGMPLQSDPTVIYALTGGRPQKDGQGPLGRRLLTKDLKETDSPYNTYLYAGIPPGPIANPGKDAIEAVLHPETHNFLYFVADGTGGHVFAETLSEHNKNAGNWRKIRASGDSPSTKN